MSDYHGPDDAHRAWNYCYRAARCAAKGDAKRAVAWTAGMKTASEFRTLVGAIVTVSERLDGMELAQCSAFCGFWSWAATCASMTSVAEGRLVAGVSYAAAAIAAGQAMESADRIERMYAGQVPS